MSSTSAESDYLRWASEQLLSHLDQEEQRHRSLESKAGVWNAAQIAAWGFVVESSSPPSTGGWPNALYWVVLVLALAAAGIALYLFQRVVRVNDYKGINLQSYSSTAMLSETNVEVRYASMLEHYTDVVDTTRRRLNDLAKAVRASQATAALTLVLLVVLLALERL